MNKKLENKIRNNYEEALSRFDFEKVHNVMEFLDWTWHYEISAPSIIRMRNKVKELFETGIEAYKGKEISISSGGFRVIIYKFGKVEIQFVVTYSYSID